MTDERGRARRCPKAGARCSTRCAAAGRPRPTTSPRQLDMTVSGGAPAPHRAGRRRLRGGDRAAPADRPARPRAALVHRHRPRRRALPEGLRRAHQRAARLRVGVRLRARRHAVRPPPRRARSATRPNGWPRRRTLKAKVAELTRILDDDGYLATLRGGRAGRVPHRRAQLRDLGGGAALRPGVHERARLHPRRAARAPTSSGCSTWSPARPTAPTRCAPGRGRADRAIGRRTGSRARAVASWRTVRPGHHAAGRRASMHVHVDAEKCQGHNRCYAIAPGALRRRRSRQRARAERRRGARRARGQGAARRCELSRVRHLDHGVSR